ncbi:MAG: DUF4199 domain-containing protein [Calditrichaeota bacterium]|nr:DUF4199 domain-containing protein [Calditrichota bacterium]
MKTVVLKYGLISGGIMVALFVISSMYAIESPEYYTIGEIIGFASIILCLLAVFFGVQHYRDEHGAGKITLKTAMAAGIQITFIASLLMGIYTFVFYETIDPGFAEKYYEYYAEQIKMSGKSADEIKTELANLNPFGDLIYSSTFQAFFMFMNVFVIGAIIAFISSLVLKKN